VCWGGGDWYGLGGAGETPEPGGGRIGRGLSLESGFWAGLGELCPWFLAPGEELERSTRRRGLWVEGLGLRILCIGVHKILSAVGVVGLGTEFSEATGEPPEGYWMVMLGRGLGVGKDVVVF